MFWITSTYVEHGENMKRKISLLVYAVAVTLWPLIIWFGTRIWSTEGSYLAAFILFHNWGLSVLLIPLSWWGWFDTKPILTLSAGTLFCLPIVYYGSYTQFILMNLVFGLTGIGLGLANRKKRH